MQFSPKNTVSTKASTSLNTNGTVEVWTIHIDSVFNKLTTVCFMIRSVRPYMTLSSLVNIILCFIQYSHMVLYFGGRQPTLISSLYYKKE
jgi:hypothetical protein